MFHLYFKLPIFILFYIIYFEFIYMYILNNITNYVKYIMTQQYIII